MEDETVRDRLLDWAEPCVGELGSQILIPDQPVLSTLGGVLAVLIACRWSKLEGLVWWKTLVAGGAAALVGVGFARVFWAISVWEVVWNDPLIVFNPYKGGQVSFGALTGAGIGSALALWKLKAPILRHADVLAPPGLFGIAFSRVGCLMRCCDYGIPSALPWAVRYPERTNAYRRHLHLDWVDPSELLSVPVHPFPLYLGASAALCGAVALLFPTLFGTKPGQRAVGTGLMYLVGRFSLEFLRQPGNAPEVYGPFQMGHLFAGCAFVVLLGMYVWLSRRETGVRIPTSG